MLIQKDVEAKVSAAVSAAVYNSGVTNVNVGGAWATANAGLVKWIESADASDPAYVSVAVASPAWKAFSEPTMDMNCTIAVFVRTELDATGATLSKIAEAIETLFKSWMTLAYQQDFTALDTDSFSVDGLSIGGGASPVVNNGICSVSWNITLSGTLK